MDDAVPSGRGDEALNDQRLRELMVRYQRADLQAAEQLVERLSPLLFRFLSHPGAPRHQAEDLLQDCWLRIHRARHTYRSDAPVLPWIYAIARHTRLDGYRRRMRTELREVELGDYPDRASAPGPRESEDLFELLNGLPESQREVVFMLKVTGMSLEEVARATASTVGAVKQRAHRAYETLRKLLARQASVSGRPK